MASSEAIKVLIEALEERVGHGPIKEVRPLYDGDAFELVLESTDADEHLEVFYLHSENFPCVAYEGGIKKKTKKAVAKKKKKD